MKKDKECERKMDDCKKVKLCLTHTRSIRSILEKLDYPNMRVEWRMIENRDRIKKSLIDIETMLEQMTKDIYK